MFGVDKPRIDFLSIDRGEFVLKVDSPDTEKFGTKPTKREYKDKEGKNQVAYEFRTNNVTGTVSEIRVEQTPIGTQLKFRIDTEQGSFVVSTSVERDYARALMEKFPATDLTKPMKLLSYDFVTTEGKRKSGVSVWQDDVKIMSYFRKDKEYLHGFPEPEVGLDADGWKIYFMRVESFLKKFTNTKYAGQ